MAKRKKHDGWCLLRANGEWVMTTAAYTKKDVRNEASLFDVNDGDRIVKVRLTEVK